MTRTFGSLLVICALGGVPSHAQPPAARVLQLGDLRFPQIDALDRERTLFILPIGMLEQHGPHLPIASDTFGVMSEANGVARRVARQLPQWNVVMMPPLHYGETGANVIGGAFIHPGTYGIRHTTLRALVADIGAEVAQNGFKRIFVLTGHAAPTHGVAVNDACDFVSETFGISMLHVTGLFRADEKIQARGKAIAAKHFSPADLASFGLDVHAGVSETSANLARQPHLVDPAYRKLPANSGQTFDQLQAIATRPGWQGYLSAPAKATAAYGRALETWWVNEMSDLALRAVDGEDLLKAPRMPATLDPGRAGVFAKALDHERGLEAKLDAWLAARRR